ncbi:MAG TPA: glycosyltransferase family 2 protein [Terracidiphilus sp.]|jgi:glycosyltransferase involved in cell wall biosynthesis
MGELVSIIVPTYNRAYCIQRTIDSVRAQSHVNWELIVVDDGSSDDTAELIRSNIAEDSRIRYVYQDNTGVSAARNTGIRAATGDLVAFLDSDDVWKSWKLNLQVQCFRAFPEIGMVWTDFASVDRLGAIVNQRHLRTMYHAYRFFPTPESLFPEGHELSCIGMTGLEGGMKPRVYIGNIYSAMLRGNLVHTSTVMVSRDRLNCVKGFDEALLLSGEDYDFHFRTCKWGKVCFVDVPSTMYQVDSSDRLSHYRAQVAMNFAKTVEAAIAREKGSGSFSASAINEVLAEAHGWAAEELFKTKDRSRAGAHAFRSLRHNPRQPRLALLLGLAIVPVQVSEALVRTYRYLKHAV